MVDAILKEIESKKVLILGFGKEGQSTFHFIRKYFPEKELFIADANENLWTMNSFLQKDLDVTLVLGERYLHDLDRFDLIIKSPGISIRHIEDPEIHNKISSQTDLFINAFHDQIVGITGSKGKSTTSSLLYHVLSHSFDDVMLVGNIGLPAFEVIADIKKDTKIVYELSAHQLEYCRTSPDTSVLLNLYEEHLDHFHSLENYLNAKLVIALNQRPEGVFYYHGDDQNINEMYDRRGGSCYRFALSRHNDPDCWFEDDFIRLKSDEDFSLKIDEKIPLPGKHNVLNIMVVAMISNRFGMDSDTILKAIHTFEPLEHRLEFVGTYDEIAFYNDSIATIPEACINAISTIPNVETLILGGFDRGIYYKSLVNFLEDSTIKNVICIGKAGERLISEISANRSKNLVLYFCESYEEIVEVAFAVTRPEKAVLLSPAAASYDMFKNFEERGRVFKDLVREYK
jgi:UDP-N-acetylmuramoylalanine--D-glutamate ligase